MTVHELKQQFIDHLGNLDKDKMNMYDLSIYVNILKTVSDMSKPDTTATLLDICNKMYAPAAMPDFLVKEDNKNG